MSNCNCEIENPEELFTDVMTGILDMDDLSEAQKEAVILVALDQIDLNNAAIKRNRADIERIQEDNEDCRQDILRLKSKFGIDETVTYG